MDVFEKLTILSDAAKYDVACTSSGVEKKGEKGSLGNAQECGICHSFSADGRCISLLKVLMTNYCVYNCKYCVNNANNDTKRAAFTPEELAELTMNFYKRNYIEGLFLSSAIIKNPDYTTEQMIKTLELLRDTYRFNGYIHVKAIPGADEKLIHRIGQLADRMSINIELPSEASLNLLAPDKSRKSIITPMSFIRDSVSENKTDLVKYKAARQFVPAGQSTQMIVGATPDTDYQIMRLAEGLYDKYKMKRVFYSAYMPVVENSLLPAITSEPPLLREHRLYQADWLLRYYGFKTSELLDEEHQNFNPYLDPKANWAINNMSIFPVEINKAPYELLLRVPGVGVKSARRIMQARRVGALDYIGLKKIGVVLKRAQYFITCKGKVAEGIRINPDRALSALVGSENLRAITENTMEQMNFFRKEITREEVVGCLNGQI